MRNRPQKVKELSALILMNKFQEKTGHHLKEIYLPRIMSRWSSNAWKIESVAAAEVSWRKGLRGALMLFTNDQIPSKNRQGYSMLLSIIFQKPLFGKKADTQVRISLSATPALTVLEYILSPSCSKIDYSRLFQDHLLDWRYQIALPFTAGDGAEMVYKQISADIQEIRNPYLSAFNLNHS